MLYIRLNYIWSMEKVARYSLGTHGLLEHDALLNIEAEICEISRILEELARG